VKKRGMAQLGVILGMLLLAILIPSTVKLVEQRVELRMEAADSYPTVETKETDYLMTKEKEECSVLLNKKENCACLFSFQCKSGMKCEGSLLGGERRCQN